MLAVIDFVTQVLLVVLGFVLVFNPTILQREHPLGHRRRPGASSSLAIPVAMLAYTGIETVSNLAEEARDPRSHDPELDQARRGRRLRDLPHAAAGRALGDARARW